MYKSLELLGLQRWLSWTSACRASMRIRVQIPRIYIKSQARSWGNGLAGKSSSYGRPALWITEKKKLKYSTWWPTAVILALLPWDGRWRQENWSRVREGPASLEYTSQLQKHGENSCVSKVGGEDQLLEFSSDLHTHAVDPHVPTHTYLCTHTNTKRGSICV